MSLQPISLMHMCAGMVGVCCCRHVKFNVQHTTFVVSWAANLNHFNANVSRSRDL